jgi:Leucine Rich repeats (2 copies)
MRLMNLAVTSAIFMACSHAKSSDNDSISPNGSTSLSFLNLCSSSNNTDEVKEFFREIFDKSNSNDCSVAETFLRGQESLSIGSYRVNIDLTPLEGLANLKILEVKAKDRILGLKVLGSLNGLNELNVFYTEIVAADLQELGKSKSIKILNLFQNKISDISSLSDMTQLEVLQLGNNKIENVSPLASLENLTRLRLSGNKIVDASSLSNLKRLIELNLKDNPLSNSGKCPVTPDVCEF